MPAYDATDELERQSPGDAWEVTAPAPGVAARPTWVEGVGYLEDGAPGNKRAAGESPDEPDEPGEDRLS